MNRAMTDTEKISIHASRGGSDSVISKSAIIIFLFQSTLPAGEATLFLQPIAKDSLIFQSTLPAGEATVHQLRKLEMHCGFQSTLPAGEATAAAFGIKPNFLFQSTLPAGEATMYAMLQESRQEISIHASRGGSDRPVYC